MKNLDQFARTLRNMGPVSDVSTYIGGYDNVTCFDVASTTTESSLSGEMFSRC